MTREELMLKRVIVQNLWPDCYFDVGEVLIKNGDYYITGIRKIRSYKVEPYPYLMRPLS
jgi:hypothetical protein